MKFSLLRKRQLCDITLTVLFFGLGGGNIFFSRLGSEIRYLSTTEIISQHMLLIVLISILIAIYIEHIIGVKRNGQGIIHKLFKYKLIRKDGEKLKLRQIIGELVRTLAVPSIFILISYNIAMNIPLENGIQAVFYTVAIFIVIILIFISIYKIISMKLFKKTGQFIGDKIFGIKSVDM